MKYYFFFEDIAALELTMEEHRKKIQELGKEQGEMARQTTEIFGHDDACQEAVHDARILVISRLNNLREIINNAVVVNPEKVFDSVRLGATVELSDGRLFRIGSYMITADHKVTNISYTSPLAKVLLNKQVGDEIEFRGKVFLIRQIF